MIKFIKIVWNLITNVGIIKKYTKQKLSPDSEKSTQRAQKKCMHLDCFLCKTSYKHPHDPGFSEDNQRYIDGWMVYSEKGAYYAWQIILICQTLLLNYFIGLSCIKEPQSEQESMNINIETAHANLTFEIWGMILSSRLDISNINFVQNLF